MPYNNGLIDNRPACGGRPHRQHNPAGPPDRYRSVRLHPAYREKQHPTPEEMRAKNARSEQYRQWMREARESA